MEFKWHQYLEKIIKLNETTTKNLIFTHPYFDYSDALH